MRKLAFLLICIPLISTGQQAGKILVYTHNGKGYVHENIAASVAAWQTVCSELGYNMVSTDDPAYFTEGNLKDVQCIIFSNTNNEAFTEESQKSVFVDYIHRGGGFVGVHSASGSEREWPWFWAMQGGKFVRHPKLQQFTIKVIDQSHPATSFLGETWSWEDECYYTNQLNPDIHVLLAADLTTVEDDKKDEYPGTTFGNYFPLSWCHTFEGGRQFYTALGHKPSYYKDEKFLKHLRGGLQWVLKH
jgi:type 1 glutamine amidotransferase